MPLIAASAEPMDALANRMYAADARHPAARATMQRLRPPARS